MYYKFNVNITEQDYFEYNKFWMTKSHYGKNQLKTFRIILAAAMLVVILISLISGRFSLESVIQIIPYVVILCIFELGMLPFVLLLLKLQFGIMKKSGKMAYTPRSVIEFFDDRLVETSDENKTEFVYSAVERISIINGKIIYIHINNVMAYLLPVSSFDSKEQYNAFIEFIKNKNSNIDFY